MASSNESDDVNNNPIVTKKITTTNGSKTIVTTEETTSANVKNESISIDAKIPETYLVVVALIVLIILFPQLKTLKAGPVEIELQTQEGVGVDTILSPAQDGFVSEGGYMEPNT